ncbi:hypothetical protein BH11ACT8_BH11ACT8_13770 [soil metagenome]
MTPLRRWCVVGLLAVLVATAPLLPRLRPVSASEVSAADLLTRVQGSASAPYSGLAESNGRVQLAVGDTYSDLADLFGASSRMRVWWAGADAWRVDRLLLSGEQDLTHDGATTTSYDYEKARAVRTRAPDVRLPRTVDLVPPSLARITLAGASAEEVSRLPARRVAGVDAPGLRFVPASGRTTIDRVDLGVDERSGNAVRVEVYSGGGDRPDVTTTFTEYSAGAPAAADVAFRPSAGVQVDVEDAFDLLDAADRYAPYRTPRTVDGVPLSSSRRGAVGVYGEGVDRFLVVPLRVREAGPLRDALLSSPGARKGSVRLLGGRYQVPTTLVGLGPLGLLLTGYGEDDGWLVAGTVTRAALRSSARDLLEHVRYVGERR